MEHVILVIHLMLAISIVVLVLIQRSEGGGLGIGGSGGGLGSFATPKATANALTRTTWILAACFFTTSLVLGIMAGRQSQQDSILDSVPTHQSADATDSVPADLKDIKDKAAAAMDKAKSDATDAADKVKETAKKTVNKVEKKIPDVPVSD